MKDASKANRFEAEHESLSGANDASFSSTLEGNLTSNAQADFEVYGGGSVFILRPLNDAATKNLEDNVGSETMWFAGGIAVEHGYIVNLVEQLRNEGWSVR